MVLTTYSLIQHAGPISVTYAPALFILAIILVSLLVGFVTGIFPARRAMKISALNAIRYE